MHALSRHNFIIRVSFTRPQLCSASRISIATTRLIGSYPKKLTLYNSYVRKQIANMSSESTQSQACCNTPAVVSKSYKPKGNYIEVDGLKTCKSTLSRFPHYLSNTLSQMPPAQPTQSKASSSSTISSASSTRRFKAPISSPTRTPTSTKSSCPTSSRASQQTSRGTRRRRTNTSRSWASSSKPRLRRPKRCRAYRRLWRSLGSPRVLKSGPLLAIAGVER
jgi:hypothetical protein